jgi:hypothetical protein
MDRGVTRLEAVPSGRRNKARGVELSRNHPLVQAYTWLDLATVARYPGWDKLGGKEAAEIRDRIASVMTAMQIAEARKLAREWKPK